MTSENGRPEHDRRLKGIAASPGIAMGKVFVYRKQQLVVEERRLVSEGVPAEIERLEGALERSRKELAKILDFAENRLGPEQAKIFEAQLLILEDAVLFDSIYKRIRFERKNAEFIVTDEIDKYRRLMANATDEYTRERAYDLEDVRQRILRNMQEQRLKSRLEGTFIIASHMLGAADAMILSRNTVLAYVTEVGGATSHMALLARALKIPTVVGVHQLLMHLTEDCEIIVDGYEGVVILHPSERTKAQCLKRQADQAEFEQQLQSLRELPAETRDGHRVTLSSNIELVTELEYAKRQGTTGVGLYRSETLLIGRHVFPSEDYQYRHYHQVAVAMAPNRVVIRTFDIGGDKFMAQHEKEQNPFLGWRGIRVMLDQPQVFLDQLRAILRASAEGNIDVMFPMVSNIKEVRLAKQLLRQAQDDLKAEGIPFDEKIRVGIMIEVPAAAVLAEDLAREVDFLSIGTNDLIQYLLAVDRGNDIVSELYQEFHPAVVRFLRRIIQRGKAAGAEVSMCGEMAGDPLATILLLGLGLDTFSVVPDMLPEIKKIIRSIHYSEAVHVAERVLLMDTEDDIRSFLETIMKQKFPEIPVTSLRTS